MHLISFVKLKIRFNITFCLLTYTVLKNIASFQRKGILILFLFPELEPDDMQISADSFCSHGIYSALPESWT